jgi:hypothetical protein
MGEFVHVVVVRLLIIVGRVEIDATEFVFEVWPESLQDFKILALEKEVRADAEVEGMPTNARKA